MVHFAREIGAQPRGRGHREPAPALDTLAQPRRRPTGRATTWPGPASSPSTAHHLDVSVDDRWAHGETDDHRPDQAFYEALIDSSPLVVFRARRRPARVVYVSDNCERGLRLAPRRGHEPRLVVGWSRPPRRHRARPRPTSRPSSSTRTSRQGDVPAAPRGDGRTAGWRPAAPGSIGHGATTSASCSTSTSGSRPTPRQAASSSVETEIRRSELFLDSIVENIPNMVFVKDAEDLRFVRFNRAGEELIGGRRATSCSARTTTTSSRRAGGGLRPGRPGGARRRRRCVDIPEEEIDTRTTARGSCTPARSRSSTTTASPRYLLGISEDITERRSADDALRRGQGGGRAGQPGQERVPLAHEPRAAHAAQRDPRLRPAARAGRAGRRRQARPSTRSSRAAGTCST